MNVERYRYQYPGGDRPALDVEVFAVREGEFALVLGGSGSGKSTLLRAIRGLVPLFHGGTASGRLEVFGTPVRDCDPLMLAGAAGVVFQDPESQMFMTRVEREVAFGLQNLGCPAETIRRCVSEALNYLGITHLKDAYVPDLSGGEKQKVALASVLAMQPRILLLDEPTSQLDPVAAGEFVALIRRVNEDFGTTVIMAEQRLDKCFDIADSVWLCDEGKIKHLGGPRDAVRTLFERGIDTPIIARLFGEAGSNPLPLTVRDGRAELARRWRPTVRDRKRPAAPRGRLRAGGDSRRVLVELRGVSHCFDDADSPASGGRRPALSDVSLVVREGEFLAVLGGNGAGKSTLLRVIAGLTRPAEGRVAVCDGCAPAWLSQNPNDHLTCDTVREEISASLERTGRRHRGPLDAVLDALDLRALMVRNPRDLSSGERERVAIAATLAGAHELLLLDEPTRGMDLRAKRSLVRLLREAVLAGAAVIVVTHDVDMAAACASRVIVMSGGEIVADAPPQVALDGALFYSPQVNKLFKHWVDGVVTYEDALSLLREGWNHAG
ncbi:MAG: ABC transporter ATP-binding protein [Bacillota bacterium]